MTLWLMNLSELCDTYLYHKIFSKMMLNPCPSRYFREKLVNSCVYELSFVLNSNVHK